MLEEVRLNLTSSARAEEDRAGQGARARKGMGWDGRDGMGRSTFAKPFHVREKLQGRRYN